MNATLPSLRRRLLSRLIPALIAAIGLGGITSYVIAKHAADYAYDQALAAAAFDVASGIRDDGRKPSFDLSPQSERILRSDEQDDIYFAVRSADGAILGGDRDLDETSPLAGRDAVSSDLAFRNRTLRAMSIRFVRNDAAFVVTVAETTHKRQAVAWAIFAQLMLPTLLVLLIAVAIVWFSVRAGLHPLAELQAELEARSEQDLSPVDTADAPFEVRSFIVALNQLLARLEATTSLHQAFVADAAHQLRTPLAGVQTQVEILATRLKAEEPTLERLRFSVARAIRLANQLVALARSEMDANVLRLRRFDIAALVAEAADSWVHRALETNIDLGFALTGCTLVGDPYLIHELLENLIDNALQHTPPGGRVTVGCRASGDLVEVTVEDSGPGVARDVAERIFERFYRHGGGAETGSGLGLAIVRQIAVRHDGDATAGVSPSLGGLQVTVRLLASGPGAAQVAIPPTAAGGDRRSADGVATQSALTA